MVVHDEHSIARFLDYAGLHDRVRGHGMEDEMSVIWQQHDFETERRRRLIASWQPSERVGRIVEAIAWVMVCTLWTRLVYLVAKVVLR